MKAIYEAKFCEQARKLVALGATEKQTADFFGVALSTFYRWRIEHEDFAKAVAYGRRERDNQVERSLFERAVGYSHAEEKVFCQQGEIFTHTVTKHYPPDTGAMIFWLKNRRPEEWKDRREHEVTGPEGAAIAVKKIDNRMSERDAATIYQQMMKASGVRVESDASAD